jgi:hypothetical protein
MSVARQPMVTEDPAGLDKLLLAAAKGCARFLEAAAKEKGGVSLDLWDGKDGLGAVLEEHLKRAGVPNKRLPELVTPRAIINAAFQPARPRERKRRVNRTRRSLR